MNSSVNGLPSASFSSPPSLCPYDPYCVSRRHSSPSQDVSAGTSNKYVFKIPYSKPHKVLMVPTKQLTRVSYR